VVSLSAGLAGFARGIAADLVTVGGSLSYAGGIFRLSAAREETLGLALDLGLAGYGALAVLGQNLCTLYWPLFQQHSDIVLTSGMSLDVSVGRGGLSVALVIRPLTVSPLAFGDLPVALRRDMFHDDCPLCGILYRLGWMPSQRGGAWTGPPRPPWAGPLPDVNRRDPGIASGALCRGACGPDCDTCKNLGDEYVCEDTGDGQHVVWVYPNYTDCPTHDGCRQHDACYDWCADNGETSVAGPMHRLCDLECLCTHSVPECVGWIRGKGEDSRMIFSDEPAVIGGCQGACPDKEPTKDLSHFTVCLPEFELVAPRRFSEPLFDVSTDEVELVTFPVPVPYIGEIPVTLAASAGASGSVGGGLGPVRVINACLVPDPITGGYKGTGELHLEADLVGTLTLTGTLRGIAGFRCLAEVASAAGTLTAKGTARLKGDLAARAEVACRDGEFGLDVGVTFEPCLELSGSLSASLHVEVFSFEVFTDSWNLGNADWKNCWQIDIATFSLGRSGGAPSSTRAGPGGAAAAALTSGTDHVFPTALQFDAVAPEKFGMLSTLVHMATTTGTKPPGAPADPAAAAKKPNPCDKKKPSAQCGITALPTPKGDVIPTKGLFANKRIHHEQKSNKHTKVADCTVAQLEAAVKDGDPTHFIGELSRFVEACPKSDVSYGSQLANEGYGQYAELVRLALELVLTQDDFDNKPVERDNGSPIGLSMRRGKSCVASGKYEVKDVHPDPKISLAHIFPK
jgi:hypothetical protein